MATTGSTIGINTANISKMQTALESYIKEVNTKVEISASRAVIQKAIKGSTSENELMELNKRIDAQFEEVTKKLSEFSNILTEMKAQYEKNDTSNTSFSNAAKQG